MAWGRPFVPRAHPQSSRQKWFDLGAMARRCSQSGRLVAAYLPWYVCAMADHISIRDLQKMSSESIGALPGPTPVKSGDRTVGLLVPLRSADPERLAKILADAEALARGRDAAA